MGSNTELDQISSEPELESQFISSSLELPKGNAPNYSIDGVEDGDNVEDIYSKANPARPGFTKYDQKDMYRMGKIQRLRVSRFTAGTISLVWDGIKYWQ